MNRRRNPRGNNDRKFVWKQHADEKPKTKLLMCEIPDEGFRFLEQMCANNPLTPAQALCLLADLGRNVLTWQPSNPLVEIVIGGVGFTGITLHMETPDGMMQIDDLPF